MTQKIKSDGKIYENGSRQTIAAIDGEKMRFESGLELRLDDGRVRQGDAVTTYKAQGASKAEMIRVEDNRSLQNEIPFRGTLPSSAPELSICLLFLARDRKGDGRDSTLRTAERQEKLGFEKYCLAIHDRTIVLFF